MLLAVISSFRLNSSSSESPLYLARFLCFEGFMLAADLVAEEEGRGAVVQDDQIRDLSYIS